jgi:site-specific recombinase XerD
MKNIKSVIRKGLKDKNSECLLYTRYTYNRKYILFSAGFRIKPYLFNSISGRIKKSENYDLKNVILRQKEIELEKIVLELLVKNEEPTLYNVKKKYYESSSIPGDLFIQQKSKLKIVERQFFKDFDKFIEAKKLEQIGKETIKTYKTTITKLKEFQDEKKYLVDYNSINKDFYNKFLLYLYGKKLLNNTIDKHIKNLKLFMKYELAQGTHTNLLYQNFKRTRTKTDFVILEIPELKKLYQHKFTDKIYDKIRDFFLLGCSTGLRFSDLNKLNSGNFVLNQDPFHNTISQHPTESYINIYTNKTGETLKLPLNNFIIEFIYKYKVAEGEFKGLKMTNQKFNELIKLVCQEAKIDSAKQIVKKMGTETKVYSDLKYKFVSSHTMRRSFISLLAHYTNPTNIQMVSGHKDIKVLTDYIKKTDKDFENVSNSFNGEIFNTSKFHHTSNKIVIKDEQSQSPDTSVIKPKPTISTEKIVVKTSVK